MRKSAILSMTVFMLSLASVASASMRCDKTEYDSSYNKKLDTVEESAINMNEPLFSGGALMCNVSINYLSQKENVKTQVSYGDFNGIKYRVYYSDGSGTIQGEKNNTLDFSERDSNWSLQCLVDGMADTHMCHIRKGDLYVWLSSDGSPFVSIGNNHYPGTGVAIRIDKLKPIDTQDKGFVASSTVEKILSELKSGNIVMTRYQKWPYKAYVDRTVNLYGFKEAYEILKKVQSSI